MTAEADFERVRQEAGPCPRCAAVAAKPILWGMPLPGDSDRYGDRVGWGGCCPPDPTPAYVCGGCGESYGRLEGDHNPLDL